MARVLLVNPSYSANYGSAKGTITNPIYPTLGLTTIAGEALRRGHQVRVLDMSYRAYDWRFVREEILREKPDIVGITATTPLMNQLRDLSVLCKDISQDLMVVGGGAHVSGVPVESMQETMLDFALTGEADLTFGELCDGDDPKGIRGLYRRDGAGNIEYTGVRPLIDDLDDLAMPAWHLYDPQEYRDRISRILVRRPPATIAEFSRGCVYKCDFCMSKMTMALGYRKKSPERCAEEVRHLRSLGWREFMLADDIFTSDNAWAASVADAITATGADMTWTCNNGIRVESADEELFRTLRRAGCYRVSFGLESGNDEVLRAFGKGGKASLSVAREAVRKARAAGIDTNGFFLLGLSADTEDSMRDTIEFARGVGTDTVLFGIAVPFPGTKMFADFVGKGLMRSFDWDEYYAWTPQTLYAHPQLDHETVRSHMKLAYRRAITMNPRFLARRLRRAVRTGELFWDAYYAAKLLLLPSSGPNDGYAYYARDRWPRIDYEAHAWDPVQYQKAGSGARRVA